MWFPKNRFLLPMGTTDSFCGSGSHLSCFRTVSHAQNAGIVRSAAGVKVFATACDRLIAYGPH
jgi:hypothetical protein